MTGMRSGLGGGKLAPMTGQLDKARPEPGPSPRLRRSVRGQTRLHLGDERPEPAPQSTLTWGIWARRFPWPTSMTRRAELGRLKATFPAAAGFLAVQNARPPGMDEITSARRAAQASIAALRAVHDRCKRKGGCRRRLGPRTQRTTPGRGRRVRGPGPAVTCARQE